MLIYLLIWAIAINWLAYHKGFYRIPSDGKTKPLTLPWSIVMIPFGIYLFLALLGAPLLVRLLLWTIRTADPEKTFLPTHYIFGIQVVISALIFLSITSYVYNRNQKVFRKMWKDRNWPGAYPIGFDFGLGALTWFLCFPLVTVFSQLSDLFVQNVFTYQPYEQTAVKFFKAAMSSPSSLFFAFLAILILAPLIEEFLFRGLLQTFLRRYLGVLPAILISALCFGLFHFSLSQGLGNITLILSFIFLGAFLGFLYQRQGSLWACVGLHMTFNTISAVRILFSSEVL